MEWVIARRLTSGTAGLVLPCIGLLVLVASLQGCREEQAPAVDPQLVERAMALHRDAIVVDTHSDTTPRFEDPSWDFSTRHDAVDGHMDLPRMREGGLDVQFWSIYTGKAEAPGEAMRIALERIDAVHQMVERYPNETGLALGTGDVRRLVGEGRIASLMGVEGGHMIEDNLSILRDFHRLGVRYMTLTHSFHTGWADSSGTTSVPPPVHGGLTAFGEEIVAEMNRIGMMVDVSHVSDETFEDVMRVSRAPVLASHSSCRAVADHPRNMSDDMLRALAVNGGVVMINFYPAYIDEKANAEVREYFAKWRSKLETMRDRTAGDLVAQRLARKEHYTKHPVPQTDLSILLDHFDHAIEIAGADHVGIGADWDGVPSMPREMADVTQLPRITLGLLGRGHSEAVVRKVLGENLLRVMAEVEAAAAPLR